MYKVIKASWSTENTQAVLADYEKLIRDWFRDAVSAQARAASTLVPNLTGVLTTAAYDHDYTATATVAESKAVMDRLAAAEQVILQNTESKATVAAASKEAEAARVQYEALGHRDDFVRALLYFVHVILDEKHDKAVREAHQTLRFSSGESLTWNAAKRIILRGKLGQDVLGALGQVLNRLRST